MNDNEKLYYPYNKDKSEPIGGFALFDVCALYQGQMDKYNRAIAEKDADEKDIRIPVYQMAIISRRGIKPTEFRQAMTILYSALAKKYNFYDCCSCRWIDYANASFDYGDLEFCREFVIRALKKSSKSDVRNSNRQYISLSNENKDENAADILGMVIDELKAEGDIGEEGYNALLKDFAKPLEQWRNLEVPKAKNKESYDIIYQIIELCYKNKAYHTAMRLCGLLLACDQTEKQEYLSKTMLLTGKITYELGYMEIAKRCFITADEEAKGECWSDVEDKYSALLNQETKLQLTDEIINGGKRLKEKVDAGELKLYTEEEKKKYYAGELEVEFPNLEKQEKDRKKLGEKAVKKYEKYAEGSEEERMKGIEQAFAVLTESPEVYEAAAYLYYLKANIFVSRNDYQTAYEYFEKAYKCEKGKQNGLVLLGTAISLSQMGRMKEAVVYLYRTYILCGEKFIIDRVGEKTFKLLEKYL